MELRDNSVWILPALELNLCLRMLGAGKRQVLPVAVSDTALDHRVLNSFLYLLELGLVEPEGESFRPSGRMRTRLSPLAHPRRILRLGDGKEFTLALYLGDGAATLAEAMGEDGQSCRLTALAPETLPEELERLAAAQRAEYTELELLDGEGESLLREKLPEEPGNRIERLRAILAAAGGNTEG